MAKEINAQSQFQARPGFCVAEPLIQGSGYITG